MLLEKILNRVTRVKNLLPVCLVTGLLTYAIEYFRNFFHFIWPVADFLRIFLSLISLISAGLFIYAIENYFFKKIGLFIFQDRILRRLDSLEPGEIEILRMALRSGSKIITGNPLDPSFRSLRLKGIIDYNELSIFHQGDDSYLVHDFIWEQLMFDERFWS